MLALLLFVALHSRSEGRSDFVLDDNGRVDITIKLGHLDLPELCNVDFSLTDRAREEQKLDDCLNKNFPRLLRVRGDGAQCAIDFKGWTDKSSTITLDAVATCKKMPSTLIVDWGFFVGSPLDHVSIATVQQPHAEPRLAMLSKRAPKLVIDVASPKWPYVVAAGASLTSIAAALLVIAWRRRRARG